MKLQGLVVLALWGLSLAAVAADVNVGADKRQAVHVPSDVRTRFLTDMRGHLQQISDIQAALSNRDFLRAAQIAQQHLGMTAPESAACHMTEGMGMNMDDAGVKAFPRVAGSDDTEGEMAKYMPEGMHDVGMAMHKAADRFATVSKAAAATADYASALRALNQVTEQCLACHAQYRVVEQP